MQGLGSGVAHPGGPGTRYAHITSGVRRNNLLFAGALAVFVGGVYSYTYAKMTTNELVTLSSELDEVRAMRAAKAGEHPAAVVPPQGASSTPAAAAAGAAAAGGAAAK